MKLHDILNKIIDLAGGRPAFNIHLNDEENVVGVAGRDSFLVKTERFNKNEHIIKIYIYENGEGKIRIFETRGDEVNETDTKCPRKEIFKDVNKILEGLERF